MNRPFLFFQYLFFLVPERSFEALAFLDFFLCRCTLQVYLRPSFEIVAGALFPGRNYGFVFQVLFLPPLLFFSRNRIFLF